MKLVIAAAALAFVAIILPLPVALHGEPAKRTIDPSLGRIEVTLDLPKDKPYVGEMIMLRMRSFVRADIVRDEIRQPALVNFDSQQLGRDKPVSAMVDGFQVAGIERDIAIFPQQSGRLIIEPFVRHVEIDPGDGSRISGDFASKRVYVDIQNQNGVAGAKDWWLPVKSLTLTDNWSVAPDEIKPGTLSRRTVTVEAVGITADRLPPAPKIIAPGTIAFRGPARRETTITEDGPVARATYQWDIRPTSASPAKLPLIQVPWYDTSERRMRTAAIPDVWVAYIGTLVHTAHEQAKTWSQIYLSPGPVAAGFAGFAWTAAVAGLLLSSRRSPRGPARRRARALRALRRAGRFNDEEAFRTALGRLVRNDPLRWERASHDPQIAPRLAALDRARYGPAGGSPPALDGLAEDIARLMIVSEADEIKGGDTLPLLDAPDVAPLAWHDRLRRRLA